MSDVTQPIRSPEVVSLEGIETSFGKKVVHRGIDLEIRRGEIVALVGGSGSGKTTLLREVLGLERPDAGTIRIFGQQFDQLDEDELQALRQRWGVLFQSGALFTNLTVAENVEMPLRELDGELPDELVEELSAFKIAMVGLAPEAADLLPAELSGGMIKRAALARALALEPELLLLDEPTSGLDPISSEAFVRLLASLRDRLTLTVLMITHDLDTLVDLCDRVAVLAEGRVVAYGSVEEVAEIDHPFVQDFFRGPRGARALSGL